LLQKQLHHHHHREVDERCDREQREKQKEKKTSNNNNNKKVAATAGGGEEKVSTKKGKGEGEGCPPTTTKTTNEEGHFEYTLGESLGPNDRFKILAPLGEGTFGKVLECYDRMKQEYCAVKVIRNVPKYKAAAKIEVDVLKEIGRRDERDEFHCIRLKESFEHEGHACLMFDMYGLSLFDFMKKNHYKPFSLALVQKFAKQLIKAVAFMHELKMTHTDLKPENVLLEAPGYVRVVSGDVNNANNNATNMATAAAVATTTTTTSACTIKVPVTSAIKLIDFGSTTLEDQYHSTIVSTRHYRAPEIILGTGWSYPCDMWSIGCILIELLTGDALFQTHENMEHLAMMRNVLGHMHTDVIKRSSKETIEKYFNSETYELSWPEGAKDIESERAVQAVQPLDIMIRERFECEETGTLLRHLLSRLLEYDPDTRITAKDALNHGFFRLDIKENAYIPTTAFASNQISVTNAAKPATDRTASSVVRNVGPTNSKARSQTTGGIRGACLDKPSMATEIVLGA
jgi:dual-specificity kinase